jgi:hypothetical protein
MTIEIIIPLSVVTDWFYSIDIRIFMGALVFCLGITMLLTGVGISPTFNPLVAIGMLFIIISMVAFALVISEFIISSAPPEFALVLSNATTPPINFKVV